MRAPLLLLSLLVLAPGCGDSAAKDTLDVPENQWTWVPFAESRCMNGTPTGIGVYRAPQSTELLIYLAPGGACFNAETCARASYPDGYGEPEFRLEVLLAGNRGVFSRSAADNPFRDWNVVYVPYCSGDVHAGRNPAGPEGRVHVGYENLGAYLARVVPTFGGATKVVLAGSSAGGIGAALNFDRVQQAFGNTPVQLLDDSGPMFDEAFLRPCLQEQWRQAWNLDAAFPADCSDCTGPQGDYVNLFGFLARKYPERRFGLISSTQDQTFRFYLGFSDLGDNPDCTVSEPMDAATFEAGLAALRTRLSADTNFQFFSPASEKHVYLLDPSLSATQVQGVSLSTWLEGLAEGQPGWGSVVGAGTGSHERAAPGAPR
ncbi:MULTISPECIES: pectin acetylesterase-family hydrolase [Myxococcaceae]|uniref:pectin acetylesterase-family hydrolase n=1 Tax=Myxococcaceae TaxID=31 RepID=UPI00188FF22A|nr:MULTISPECIES: pectin acetylesterase-family hydrolase [Myxococcaceae]MBF5042190.1 hypothetical protein [Simulacricoccus sp. 17bor-14]